MTPRLIKPLVFAAPAIAAALFTAHAAAAPINYGDFSDTPPGSVMYLDVTETANTPGDEGPLFGAPSVVGNQLDFDPAGFSAVSENGGADLTDGQLNFTVMAAPGFAIDSLDFRESGDFSTIGVGSSATQASWGFLTTGATVTEIDGVELATPLRLGNSGSFSGTDLRFGSRNLWPWSLSQTLSIHGAVSVANIPFQFGATKVEFVIDNSLAATSESGTIAFVAKKDFYIDVTTRVPEPASAALLGLSVLCLATRRK